jgi:hypothetical protein
MMKHIFVKKLWQLDAVYYNGNVRRPRERSTIARDGYWGLGEEKNDV